MNGFVIDSIKRQSVDKTAEKYVLLLNKIEATIRESYDIKIEAEYND